MRANDSNFDDPILLTRGTYDDVADGPASSGRFAVVAAREEIPGFPDEVRIDSPTNGPPVWQPGRSTVVEGGEVFKGREDTDLGRSRAQRRGQGGGPTRSEQERDEREGEEFKSELLVRTLGLEDTPYNVFGWLQASFTGNPGRPVDGTNFGVNPNYLANAFLFQEFFFAFEKPLDPDKSDAFDYGFRVDNLFGTDWNQYHMVGLFDGLNRWKYFGWEPVQFYGEVHLPWVTPGGVDVKAGRFFSLGGYEDFLAPGRPLNSGSYQFAYSQPFTHVGVMTTWHVTDRFNVFNGAVNGWDRWIDRNYRWGYAGGFAYESPDARTNLTMTLNVGPIQFPFFFPSNYKYTPNGVPQPPFLAGRRNTSYGLDNAVLFTGILIHEWTETLTLVVEQDDGYETNVPSFGTGGSPTNAGWYGVAGWLLYAFNDRLTGVYRGEAFRDNNGVRTGFNDTYYEMTLGLIAKPRSWFWVRPEVRFDWANGAPPYDNGTKFSQLTLGFDTIFLF